MKKVSYGSLFLDLALDTNADPISDLGVENEVEMNLDFIDSTLYVLNGALRDTKVILFYLLLDTPQPSQYEIEQLLSTELAESRKWLEKVETVNQTSNEVCKRLEKNAVKLKENQVNIAF